MSALRQLTEAELAALAHIGQWEYVRDRLKDDERRQRQIMAQAKAQFDAERKALGTTRSTPLDARRRELRADANLQRTRHEYALSLIQKDITAARTQIEIGRANLRAAKNGT